MAPRALIRPHARPPSPRGAPRGPRSPARAQAPAASFRAPCRRQGRRRGSLRLRRTPPRTPRSSSATGSQARRLSRSSPSRIGGAASARRPSSSSLGWGAPVSPARHRAATNWTANRRQKPRSAGSRDRASPRPSRRSPRPAPPARVRSSREATASSSGSASSARSSRSAPRGLTSAPRPSGVRAGAISSMRHPVAHRPRFGSHDRGARCPRSRRLSGLPQPGGRLPGRLSDLTFQGGLTF